MGLAMISRVLSHFRDHKRPLVVAVLLCLCWIATRDRASFAAEELNQNLPSASESYALPISPPLDQGDSDLCWVYAALSMLETNYMVRHPGSRIELSRGALQFDSVADRFRRVIRGEAGRPEDGGLAVEAIALIR